jgi:hypothetical protein
LWTRPVQHEELLVLLGETFNMRISFDEIIKGSLPRSGFTIIDNILDDDSAFAPNNIDFISGELIKVLVPDLGDIIRANLRNIGSTLVELS